MLPWPTDRVRMRVISERNPSALSVITLLVESCGDESLDELEQSSITGEHLVRLYHEVYGGDIYQLHGGIRDGSAREIVMGWRLEQD